MQKSNKNQWFFNDFEGRPLTSKDQKMHPKSALGHANAAAKPPQGQQRMAQDAAMTVQDTIR